MKNVDGEFFNRADAHIYLANDQLKTVPQPGMVSASFMYAMARFSAWMSARGFNNGEEMLESKQKMIDYFAEEYKKMLSENLDDYIQNFESHMRPKEQQQTNQEQNNSTDSGLKFKY